MSPKSTVHGGVTNEALEQSWRTGADPEPEPGGNDESGESEDGTAEETAAVPRPGRDEPKAAWIEYAVSQGADRGEAEAMTKADLLDRYKG